MELKRIPYYFVINNNITPPLHPRIIKIADNIVLTFKYDYVTYFVEKCEDLNTCVVICKIGSHSGIKVLRRYAGTLNFFISCYCEMFSEHNIPPVKIVSECESIRINPVSNVDLIKELTLKICNSI